MARKDEELLRTMRGLRKGRAKVTRLRGRDGLLKGVRGLYQE